MTDPPPPHFPSSSPPRVTCFNPSLTGGRTGKEGMGGLIKPVHLGFENPETGKLSRRAMLLVRCFGFGQAHQSKKSVGPNQSSNSTVSKTANFLASHVASPPSSWSSLPRSVVACLASTDSLYRVVFPSWPRMAITVAVGHAALGQPASHKDDDARTGNGDRGLLLPFSKFVRNGESWLSPAALSLHPPLSLSLSLPLSPSTIFEVDRRGSIGHEELVVSRREFLPQNGSPPIGVVN